MRSRSRLKTSDPCLPPRNISYRLCSALRLSAFPHLPPKLQLVNSFMNLCAIAWAAKLWLCETVHQGGWSRHHLEGFARNPCRFQPALQTHYRAFLESLEPQPASLCIHCWMTAHQTTLSVNSKHPRYIRV